MDVSSSSVSRSPPSRGRDQRGQQVVGGVRALGRRPARARRPTSADRGVDPRAPGRRPAPATSVVDQRRNPAWSRGGHAEQLADHRDRQRVGERRDQVGLAVLGERGGEVVEEPVGDLLDPGRERVDPAAGERPGDQPAQPGVVGRVAVQQVAVHRGARRRAAAGLRAASGRALDQARVGERRADGVVAGDEPRRAAVGQRMRCTGPVAARAARRRGAPASAGPNSADAASRLPVVMRLRCAGSAAPALALGKRYRA